MGRTVRGGIPIFEGESLVADAGEVANLIEIRAYTKATVWHRLTNGAGPPGVEATSIIAVSCDGGSTYKDLAGGSIGGGTDPETVTYDHLDLPAQVTHVRVSAGNNSGEDVQADAGVVAAT